MCDFLSFIIRRKEGQGLEILATKDLTSHSDIEREFKLTDEMENCFEAEWTGNAPKHLVIRFPDTINAGSQEKIRSWVLGQYKNRNALLSYLLSTMDFSKQSDNLSLAGLESADGLTLPQSIGGGLDLRGLQSADGLTLPQSIGGGLDLAGLQSADGLTLPQSIGGWLHMKNEVRRQYDQLQKQKQS
jgi:hypothetical protein